MTANEAYRILAAFQAGDKNVRDHLDHALAAAPVGTSISTDGNGGGRVAWHKLANGWAPKYTTPPPTGTALPSLPPGMAVWSLLSLAMGTAPPPERYSDNQRTISAYESALVVIAAMRPGDTRGFGLRAGHPYDAVVCAEACGPLLHYRVKPLTGTATTVYENVQMAAEAVAKVLEQEAQPPRNA